MIQRYNRQQHTYQMSAPWDSSKITPKNKHQTVADPGFPVRGSVDPLGGGREPPTGTLFGENVCESERIGSNGGASTGHAP